MKLGDLAWMNGHVGIIVDVDEDKELLTICHISDSGKGMNMTIMSAVTGFIVDDYLGPMPKNDHTNRIGSSYFTHIISVDYSV